MSVINLTSETFQSDVLDGKGLVFVDFYAEWCQPCKMTEPIVEELSQSPDYKAMTFRKVDVDENNDIAGTYNVFSIPTFIIFKDGQPVHQFTGGRDKSSFESEIKKFL